MSEESGKPPRLTVQAEGSVQVSPDRANLQFRIRDRSRDRRRAAESSREKQAQLTRMLDSFQVPERRRRTGQLVVSELVDPQSRKGNGYEATVTTTARLEDFAQIGELVLAASEQGADVIGPSWEVSRANPGHLEACRRASASALRRAEAYAEGIGMRLGRPLRVKEGGRGWQPLTVSDMPAPPMAAAARRAGEATTIEVSSGLVRLSASVTATFELIQAQP